MSTHIVCFILKLYVNYCEISTLSVLLCIIHVLSVLIMFLKETVQFLLHAFFMHKIILCY